VVNAFQFPKISSSLAAIPRPPGFNRNITLSKEKELRALVNIIRKIQEAAEKFQIQTIAIISDFNL